MTTAEYHRYLASEISSILQFKEAEEKATGQKLSRNMAAAMWIERNAASYRERFELDCSDIRIRFVS